MERINRRFTQIIADSKLFTAETQSTLREEIFAQSGDDDWAKYSVFRRARFLFVVVSRQTKNEILCALCASAVHDFEY
jgi:hypothetical protein